MVVYFCAQAKEAKHGDKAEVFLADKDGPAAHPAKYTIICR